MMATTTTIIVGQHLNVIIVDRTLHGIHGVRVVGHDEHRAALIVPPNSKKIIYKGLELTARVIRVDGLNVDLVCVL
jgi:hypothetical protein